MKLVDKLLNAKALRFWAHATGGKTDALALAESLPGKIDALEAWCAEQSCNAEILRLNLRLKFESIESGDAEIGLRAQAQDAIDQQIMRAEAAESQLILVTKERDEANELVDKVAADSHFNFNSACQERKRADAAESELARVTAERDDARVGRKMISNGSWDTSVMFMECQKERDTLKSQLSPRISEAYTQGVKDAANKAKQHAHGYGQYRDHAQAKSACETLATEILALLPKELATEDMREKDEPTETQP